RFAPWRGKYYWAPNAGGNTLVRLTPPAGNPLTGTWTLDSVTLAGPALAPSLTTSNHIGSLAYVPAIDCLAWCVGGASPVYLLRPE
ncbi:MAG TPA: hypothetical protein VJ724_04720, partial [Tahibacter sp.]|nr:hypothetical protein [Tahibacter sp.]